MRNTTDAAPTAGPETGNRHTDGLVRARRRITAARGRDTAMSDGGGTGRTDGND
ncbi:hypothetical protein GCM10027160_28640 [Streptomyces calidiresistens]|uniref:hypothetical protein n=1 Tax=Streptomyces calidiresistens TaxID=1485586 RepID=UPI0015FAC37E|nr:hypothetical protein [Streptomyces calidiresistens]